MNNTGGKMSVQSDEGAPRNGVFDFTDGLSLNQTKCQTTSEIDNDIAFIRRNMSNKQGKLILDMDDDNDDQHTSPRLGRCISFMECSQETSFSGFKYIGSGSISSLRRLFWLLVVMGACGGLCLQIYDCVGKFSRFDTNTKLEYIIKPELDFPSVTICNSNMVRISKLAEFYGDWVSVYVSGIEEVGYLFPDQSGLSNELSPNSVSTVDSNENYYPGNQNLYDFIVNSAHTKDSMIMTCKYNGHICGPENFTTTVTNYGVCFTFNSAENDETLSIKTPGQTQGLSVILDAEEFENMAAPRENIGFKMLAHPRNEVPNLQDFGIELEIGTHTPVRLDVTEMSTLSHPHGDCGSKQLKYFSGVYTGSNCYLECETEYIVERCGCRSFYMPGNAAYCAPANLTGCFNREKVLFAEIQSSHCSCPHACRETFYTPTMSQSKFPSDAVTMKLKTRGENAIISDAFKEAVSDATAYDIIQQSQDIQFLVLSLPQSMHNAQGVFFAELFPVTSTTIPGLIFYTIYSIQFSLYMELTRLCYDEVLLSATSMKYGSEIYWSQYSYFATKYLSSGAYKQNIADGFLESGEYPDDQNFDEFIDYVYDEFDFEAVYVTLFNNTYNDMYDYLIEKSQEILQGDLAATSTEWMRKNVIHAEIFYGDLKVETIGEQPAYELFQLVCDLGGALGLFFGASLLSFIETVDFWFSRKASKENKNTACNVKKIAIQPNIISIS